MGKDEVGFVRERLRRDGEKTDTRVVESAGSLEESRRCLEAAWGEPWTIEYWDLNARLFVYACMGGPLVGGCSQEFNGVVFPVSVELLKGQTSNL